MTFSATVEQAIDKALSKMVFADPSDTTLTARDRLRIADKAVRRLVEGLLEDNGGYSVYVCPSCHTKERLNPAHEVPMHRHGVGLYILHKDKAEGA